MTSCLMSRSRRDLVRLLSLPVLVAAVGAAPVGCSRGEPVAPGATSARCIDGELRERGVVDRLEVLGDTAQVCVARGAVRGCFSFDLPRNEVNTAPLRPAVAATSATARTFRVERGEWTVRVCPSAAPCATVAPLRFTPPSRASFDAPLVARIPSDASPDGRRVLLVRHEGKRSEAIFGETYDVAKNERLARFPIPAAQHVDAVVWLGERALVKECIDDGPYCAAALVHPLTGERRPIDANLDGDRQAAWHVAGDEWLLASADGKLLFIDEREARVVAAIDPVSKADPAYGVRAVELGQGKLVVAHGGPIGATLRVIDLRARAIERELAPVACVR